jgi:hypothetical protein
MRLWMVWWLMPVSGSNFLIELLMEVVTCLLVHTNKQAGKNANDKRVKK